MYLDIGVMGFRRCILFFCLSTCILFGNVEGREGSHSLVDAHTAFVESKSEWTDIGRNVSLACRTPYGMPIERCYWKKPFVDDEPRNFIKISQENENFPDSWNSFLEQGFENGVCRITIRSVNAEDFGPWKCVLESRNEAFVGSIDIKRWVKPLTKPIIRNREKLTKLVASSTTHKANGTVDVTCCARNGVPDVGLRFQFDNQLLKQSSVTSQKVGDQMCITWTQAFLSYPSYNGKKLSCTMNHIALREDQVYEDTLELNIEYSPSFKNISSNNSTVEMLVHKHSRYLKFNTTVDGNPIPRLRWALTATNGSVLNVLKQDFIKMSEERRNGHVFVSVEINDILKIKRNDYLLTFIASNVHGETRLTYEFEFDKSGQISFYQNIGIVTAHSQSQAMRWTLKITIHFIKVAIVSSVIAALLILTAILSVLGLYFSFCNRGSAGESQEGAFTKATNNRATKEEPHLPEEIVPVKLASPDSDIPERETSV